MDTTNTPSTQDVEIKPASYADDLPKEPTDDKSLAQVLHETYQVPAFNYAHDLPAAGVTVIVGTPNTLRPPEGFPKMLYRGGDPEAGPGMLCGSQEIADDWAKRGFFPLGETEPRTDEDKKDDPTGIQLMEHQHALDAPTESVRPTQEEPTA